MRAASMKMFLLVAVLALLSRADVAQARRHYVPGHGRWLQRDPAGYVDGMSLYEYVSSRPTVLSDPTGEWGADVHRRLTFNWAIGVGMKWGAADAVGDANIATDGFWTGFLPWVGEQGRHFNRSSGGGDSRMWWRDYERRSAEIDCNPVWGPVSPSEAAEHLGRGLHSVQDWWAHGDYSRGGSDTFSAHGRGYDDWGMDATGTAHGVTAYSNGRAPQVFVTLVNPGSPFMVREEVSWPNWTSGTLRQTGTERDSTDYIRRFLSWVRSNGACECKEYFLRN